MEDILAKADAMPSASELQTRSEADGAYQPKGSYLTEGSLSPYATVAALEAIAQSVDNIAASLQALQSRFDTLLGDGDVSAVIDTFAEMEAFLTGVTNTQTLTGMLADLRADIVGRIPTGTAAQSSLDSVASRVTALEASAAAHDSGISTLETAMARRPALPDSTETGAIYAVKNGAYVCLCDPDEQLLADTRG